ncbi:MAG: 4Fe-4S binding protein [Lachnospiraceae bacterium]|nr:4Fe-4S binding protein [Lachnospiraceae bacterium]
MIRKIITIDQEKCNGCGLCAEACHEGAIGIIDGKATLLREDYCDGLGDCLPACPMDAIAFEEREALAYDEAAVLAAKREKENGANGHREKYSRGNHSGQHMSGTAASQPCGCPGSRSMELGRESSCQMGGVESTPLQPTSQLRQWPVQIKLVSPNAPYFNGANLLIAADCTAYAYGNFHNQFMRNKVTLIGCPKLDMGDYSEKLTEIISNNDIKSVTVVRMQVPCCGGIVHAVKTALQNSGKWIPWQVVTISSSGEILE